MKKSRKHFYFVMACFLAFNANFAADGDDLPSFKYTNGCLSRRLSGKTPKIFVPKSICAPNSSIAINGSSLSNIADIHVWFTSQLAGKSPKMFVPKSICVFQASTVDPNDTMPLPSETGKSLSTHITLEEKINTFRENFKIKAENYKYSNEFVDSVDIRILDEVVQKILAKNPVDRTKYELTLIDNLDSSRKITDVRYTNFVPYEIVRETYDRLFMLGTMNCRVAAYKFEKVLSRFGIENYIIFIQMRNNRGHVANLYKDDKGCWCVADYMEEVADKSIFEDPSKIPLQMYIKNGIAHSNFLAVGYYSPYKRNNVRDISTLDPLFKENNLVSYLGYTPNDLPFYVEKLKLNVEVDCTLSRHLKRRFRKTIRNIYVNFQNK
ncbi:hypothetical protein FACS189465_1670 [Clostridia bacterium]|nr:hypothetical protein FACS189465_1670 [Clostridia bacterium]